jgi:hypothetical protein
VKYGKVVAASTEVKTLLTIGQAKWDGYVTFVFHHKFRPAALRWQRGKRGIGRFLIMVNELYPITSRHVVDLQCYEHDSSLISG